MNEISAVIPSFNHGEYISQAIASVLNQTVPVSELIIVDDGSSDDSLEQIGRFSDERIKVVTSEANQGGAAALNRGIAQSRFGLIAICNSDDVWEHAKLERQIAAITKSPNIGAVFSDVIWIGSGGEKLEENAGLGNIFVQKNRSRHAWLRWLFEQGNCLCHPSVLIRRRVYDEVGLYDTRLRQLPDYKMWLNLLRKADIHVLDEKLVRFRVHQGNVGKYDPSAVTCHSNEYADIAMDFVNELDEQNFVEAFGSRFPMGSSKFSLSVEKILYLWSVTGLHSRICRWIGNTLAMRLLATNEGREAWQAYGFSTQDFFILRGLESPWGSRRPVSDYRPIEMAVLARINGNKKESRPDGNPAAIDRMRFWKLALKAYWRHPFHRTKRIWYRNYRNNKIGY